MGHPSKLNIDLAGRYAKWLVAQKYAAGTRNQYCLAVKEYSDFLDAKSFTKSTHFDVQEFIADRAKLGRSARTLRSLLYALRIFFDFLNLGGLIVWTPPRMIRPRQLEPRVPRVLTREQVNRLFAGTRNKFERAVLETRTALDVGRVNCARCGSRILISCVVESGCVARSATVL